MNWDWPDRRQAIKSSVLYKRSGGAVMHPNGFIQVKLKGGGRLHFWHPELPRQEVATPIHDHTFDMSSEVLLGSVTHVHVVPELDSTGHYKVHYALPAPGCDAQTDLVPNGQRVRAVERPALLVNAGQCYDFPAFEFHRTFDNSAAVSCIHKTAEHVGSPRVLVPYWAVPDNGFKRDAYDWDFCWRWIQDIVEDAALPEVAR